MNRRSGIRFISLLTCTGLLTACGVSSTSSSATSVNPAYWTAGSACSEPTTGSGSETGTNVLAVTVGTGLCGGNVNIPCASVKVCVPGTSTCQTISDILIDTGSYGLRIFSQALSLSLTQVKDASNHPIAECAQFGSATDWGPVMNADVYLGGEAAVNTSIQVIDRTFGTSTLPSVCSSAEASPTAAGINGILGVGLFAQDCGATCVLSTAANMYFSCNGGTCTGSTLALAKQVQNPVPLLTTDNNGVILDMPAVPATGSSTVTGALVLGIDTQTNNSSTGFTKFPASTSGYFKTTFGGQTYVDSFIDSGSNGYFFPNPGSWSTCSSWYCNGSTSSETATNVGSGGSPTGSTCFTVGDSTQLFNTKYAALSDIAASVGFASSFDWGLPFFYGRKVFVGVQSKSSNLGTGPYWAY